ncbi:Pentatricopeptide repeat-containing protein [Rhynchospora pubera]|uniref:Pentatricopeptide repeat-containing protein n=1 Tax=Rhynchospora pubera TaxID=906938 RepID=A0AAV8CGL2_9POAL|nr:Pentatricopeptide repeat-containing protein [Rhynchospora pubera]
MVLTTILLRRSHGHLLWRRLLHLHFPLFFSYSTSPDSIPFPPMAGTQDDLSNFEPEPEPAGPNKPDSTDLQSFIQHLSTAKSLSSSQKQALSLLKSSWGVEVSKELVCKAMWEVRKDWELALVAFRWGEACVANYPWAWLFIIQVVCRKERFDLAWVLVRRMYRNGILTQQAMIIIMEWYAAANQAEKAIKTFYIMDRFKLNADTETFQSLLQALCRNKNIEEAEELLLTNQKTFPLTSENFNIILNGWCNIMPDILEAKRIWREMSNYCIRPDGTSYSHMIRCFSRVDSLFDSLRLYDEMKKKGWPPPLEVYNSLIYVLTKENCMKDAKNIFERIREAGLNPNVESFNSMIHPLCEKQEFEDAQAIMEKMTVKGVFPNYETFHAFINQDNIEETLKIFRKMKEQECGPRGSTFLFLLEKYFGSNEPGNAMKIWFEMKKYQIEPDRSHYMALVKGLVKYGWVLKAIEYYNEMKSKGSIPDPPLEKMFKAFLSSNKEHWGVGRKFTLQRGKPQFHISIGANVYSQGNNLNPYHDLDWNKIR